MNRHKNKWLGTKNDTNLEMEINIEMGKGVAKFGRYNSWLEAWAIIDEELREFHESVRANDPDPEELLQVCATAKRAIIELCEQGRKEMEVKPNV